MIHTDGLFFFFFYMLVAAFIFLETIDKIKFKLSEEKISQDNYKIEKAPSFWPSQNSGGGGCNQPRVLLKNLADAIYNCCFPIRCAGGIIVSGLE